MRPTPTIKQISQRSGVSPMAVSAALGRLKSTANVGVSQQTMQRVQRVAAEMGYKPNLVARSLKTQKTNTIGVISRGVMAGIVEATKLDQVEHAVYARSYDTYMGIFRGEQERLSRLIDNFVGRQIEGLLLIDVFEDDLPAGLESLERNLAELNLPCVLVDGCASVAQQTPSITIDRAVAMQEATQMLLEAGHRRFAFVGTAGTANNQKRLGIEKQLEQWRAGDVSFVYKDFGNDMQETAHDADNPYVVMGRKFATDILSDPTRPTAVFASNDLVASGLVLQFAELGIRVPHDVSVVGYDNSWASQLMQPNLTTVQQPGRALGRAAVDMLFDLIEGAKGQQVPSRTLSTELVVRDSTGPANSDEYRFGKDEI